MNLKTQLKYYTQIKVKYRFLYLYTSLEIMANRTLEIQDKINSENRLLVFSICKGKNSKTPNNDTIFMKIDLVSL